MKKKISKKWLKMSEIYRHFAKNFSNSNFSFSDQAAQEHFEQETYGINHDLSKNGYALGKKWMNVQVKMWCEDISKGLLYKFELYTDPVYSQWHWWLDSILKNVQEVTTFNLGMISNNSKTDERIVQ